MDSAQQINKFLNCCGRFENIISFVINLFKIAGIQLRVKFRNSGIGSPDIRFRTAADYKDKKQQGSHEQEFLSVHAVTLLFHTGKITG